MDNPSSWDAPGVATWLEEIEMLYLTQEFAATT